MTASILSQLNAGEIHPSERLSLSGFESLLLRVHDAAHWARFYLSQASFKSNSRDIWICQAFRSIKSLAILAIRLARVECHTGYLAQRNETLARAEEIIRQASGQFLSDQTLGELLTAPESEIDAAWLTAAINPCRGGALKPGAAWERFQSRLTIRRASAIPSERFLFTAYSDCRQPWIVGIYDGVTQQIDYHAEFDSINEAIARFSVIESYHEAKRLYPRDGEDEIELEKLE